MARSTGHPPIEATVKGVADSPMKASTRDSNCVRITEYLDVNLKTERWQCNRCGHDLGPGRACYKEGCLIADRNPQEVHPPIGPHETYNFSFDPTIVRIIEFYCPGCGTMIENEYLPIGHPLTWDIELDLAALRERHGYHEEVS